MNQTFISYVLSFYGPSQIYGDFFHHSLTLAEVQTAVSQRLENKSLPFVGDSIDREIVRDIILKNREQLNPQPSDMIIFGDVMMPLKSITNSSKMETK